MKKDNIIKSFMIIGAGTAINMLLGLLTTPLITRIVEPTEYGQLSIFNTYGNICLMFLCLGLDQALIRFFYESEDLKYKRSLLTFCFTIPLIIGGLIGILFLIGLNNRWWSFEFGITISVLLVLYSILLIWDRFALLMLRITHHTKLYSICTIAKKIVYIVIAFVWIYFGQRDYFMGLCIATIISVLIPAIIGTLNTKDFWRFRIKTPINKEKILKYGLPLTLAMGLNQLFNAIDKLSLNTYRSYEEVGIYASALALVNTFAIIQTAFNTVWAPTQMEHFIKKPDDRGYFQRANQIITAAMFLFGIHLILFKDIFVFLLGEKYRLSSSILPFLIFHPIMYTISETTHIGIEASQKSYLNIFVSLIACLTNLIGNSILVPRIGCQGAAISTGLSYIVFFAVRTAFSNKYYYIDYKIIKLIIITIFTAIFAFHETFFKFNIVSILLYVLAMCSIIVLYNDQMQEGVKYIYKVLWKSKGAKQV